MSCFVMNSEPLAAIANFMKSLLNNGYNSFGFGVPGSLVDEVKDCLKLSGGSLSYDAESIYRKLYAVNVNAFNARYQGHEEPEDTKSPDIEIDAHVIHCKTSYRNYGWVIKPWHYKMAKLLDCWLYQTDEADVSKDAFRLAVCDLRDMLYSFIVSNSEEYKKAGWGEL